MKMRSKACLGVLLCLVLGSCASSYRNKRLLASAPQDTSDSFSYSAPPYAATMVSSAEQLKSATYSDDNERTLLSHYTTGWEFCEKNHALISTQKSFWVEVPTDYSNPNKGTIPIFAFFRDDFSRERPTVIIFDGGPGSNTHDGALYPRMSTGFNELHIDQRGIACSRPPTLDLYRDPSFYSTANIAHDADRVRAYLGLQQVSVYGDSFGSIPATRYANLFPEHTRALVLEGTYYSGNMSMDHGRIRSHLEEIYKNLPEGTQETMLGFFDASKDAWLYSFTQSLTYMYQGIYKVLPPYLASTFPGDGKIGNTSYFDPTQKNASLFNDTIDGIDLVNFSVLQCKEMHQFKHEIPRFYKKSDGKAVLFENEKMDTGITMGIYANCKSLGASWKGKSYTANQYPTTAPVTYFQGSWDTATDRSGAQKHWESVPKGKKQLLLAEYGSHLCNVMAISDPSSPTAQNAQKAVFEKALSGEMATQADVDAMNVKDAAHINQPTNVNWLLNTWDIGDLD